MKSKGLIITLIILLTIIIAGLITIMVLFINGTLSFKDFKIGGRKSENLLFNEKYSIEEVTCLDIKHDAGDIILENTNESNYIRVEVYGEKQEDVELSLIENKLTVNYKNRSGGFWENVYGDIKLYVPSSFYGNIKIENDAGEIKIANFENADFDINCDAGNVDIGKIKSIKADCDAGNIKIDSISSYCDIQVDAGNLEIKQITLDKDSKIKTDMGNVRIDKAEKIYVEGHVNLGNCNIDNNDRSSNITLKINSDMGNITVK